MGDQYREFRQAEKDHAIEEALRALVALEEQGGELTDWQRTHIADALAAIANGLYRLAATASRATMLPESAISKIPPIRVDPAIADISLDKFRSILSALEAGPVEQPRFG